MLTMKTSYTGHVRLLKLNCVSRDRSMKGNLLNMTFIQTHSFEGAKFMPTVSFYIQHSKTENFHILIISSNQSFISHMLKFIGPLGGKFDYFSPLGV